MFQVFQESILFLKSENFKNSFLPCFGDSVVGKSSHRPQLRICGSILATCSRVEGLVARVAQRFSQLSLRLPHGQTFQSRKTLRKVFQNFVFECFGGLTWRLVGDSLQLRKTRVWQKQGLFFKSFLVFPRTYCDCSLSFFSETSQTHRVTHFQLDCCFISSQNHQEKVWVLFSSSHILCLMNVFRAI